MKTLPNNDKETQISPNNPPEMQTTSENDRVTRSSTTNPEAPLLGQNDVSRTWTEDDPSATANCVYQESMTGVNIPLTFPKPIKYLPESGQVVQLPPQNPKPRDEDYLTGGPLVKELKKESNSEVVTSIYPISDQVKQRGKHHTCTLYTIMHE